LGTDLRSFTHKKQPTLADIRIYAIGMMLISHELRRSKIIHADIKPDNFLFKETPEVSKT
jgi:serine/threonine protein kinase